jgi:drug/metabolite transporter (DMT)-like permease
MSRKPLALLLVFVCTILNTVAQFFVKSAAAGFALDFSILTNMPLIIGVALYIGSLIAYLYALKFWELSSVAPALSVQYILVVFISYYFFHEQVSAWQVIGLSSIMLGVVLIVREAKA